ncbi:MAG: bifunctional DNA primase/polymerase [Pseudonocardia sp.]
MTTTDRTRLAGWLNLTTRGWHLFPVRPGGKAPAIRRWQDRATTDPDHIHRFFTDHPDLQRRDRLRPPPGCSSSTATSPRTCPCHHRPTPTIELPGAAQCGPDRGGTRDRGSSPSPGPSPTSPHLTSPNTVRDPTPPNHHHPPKPRDRPATPRVPPSTPRTHTRLPTVTVRRFR